MWLSTRTSASFAAPPRPVRLLGVRVAAFEEDGAAAEDAPQMTLAL